jgi:hypothetical protein
MPARIQGTQGDPHAGRPANARVVALTLDAEAYALLPTLAPSKRAYGQYLSRLIYEDVVRREERAKFLQEVAQRN